MAGRHKPKELRILRGTYRESVDGPIESIVVAKGEPQPPASTKGEALRYWRRIVPLILRMGVGSEADSDELAALCDWYVVWRKAVKEAKAANPKAKDYIRRLMGASMAWKQFDRIAGKFGLTPADRAKLKVEAEKPNDDPMEAFLSGGKRAKA